MVQNFLKKVFIVENGSGIESNVTWINRLIMMVREGDRWAWEKGNGKYVFCRED